MSSAGTVLKIEDLVSTTSLGIEVLAGADGLDREVLWAHSCEMRDPERWLGPHELLMTVGLCVPEGAEPQVEFVSRLDEAGLAGMMIGDHEIAPALSAAMLAEASRRGFPVLLAAEQTPYAVVARHVAAASSSSQILQVLKLSKIYQLAADAGAEVEALIENLASLLRVDLRVVDGLTGRPVLETAQPQSLGAERVPRRYRLSGSYPAELQVMEYPGEPLDSFILVHLKKIIEVNTDRLIGTADLRARTAAQALVSLLNGATMPEAAIRLLGEHSPAAGFHLVACSAAEGERIARSAALGRLPVLAGQGKQDHLVLVPHPVLPDFKRLVAETEVRFGVSSLFADYRDVGAAAEEASRVLASSQYGDRFWNEFEGRTVSVLSRSRREAETIIESVLGPLAGPAPAEVRLRETLFAYLRNDRRWQDTADELGIHRQTLSYRLGRIEKETGLGINRSADLAAFWVAYRAWESCRTEQS